MGNHVFILIKSLIYKFHAANFQVKSREDWAGGTTEESLLSQKVGQGSWPASTLVETLLLPEPKRIDCLRPTLHPFLAGFQEAHIHAIRCFSAPSGHVCGHQTPVRPQDTHILQMGDVALGT